MNTPVIIFSFNRPDYLASVLDSILAQDIDLGNYDFYLFQDAARDSVDRPPVKRCEEIFQDKFPNGQIQSARENLNVGKNFYRAFQFVFDKLNAKYGFFFEDDLALTHPKYFSTLEKLTKMALSDKRVGICACYGELATRPLEKQSYKVTELDSLGHNWGFSLTKSAWDSAKGFYGEYQKIIKSIPYKDKDVIKGIDISYHFLSAGYAINELSQDVALTIALLSKGIVKVNTGFNLGTYIGKVGEHLLESEFDERGYSKTVIWDREIPEKFTLTNQNYEDILKVLNKHFQLM